ncbi:hypothetical protein OICFNHDK_2514 [Methylobacterium bullatum]|uniref:Uncharacterized protein n=1 Tax=Methylobacterium bullatum TaxID=570505 RepID=A0A679K8V9_9HYPH|nr:hypothetical protein OICFNHDK_2514 [Methylobacterium bullatum]CAA2145064.1 hypothetical protein MBLL_04185 [Methylobacterium bullatum]
MAVAGTIRAVCGLNTVMPGCRHSTALPIVPQTGSGLRLSQFLVSGRPSVRPVNDNRPPHIPGFWPWALAIGVAPVLSGILLLALMF